MKRALIIHDRVQEFLLPGVSVVEGILVVDADDTVEVGDIYNSGLFLKDVLSEDRQKLLDEQRAEGCCAVIERGFREHVTAVVNQLGYDSEIHVMARAGYSGPFQDECVKVAQWIDSCWVILIGIQKDIKSKEIVAFTFNDVKDKFPRLTL